MCFKSDAENWTDLRHIEYFQLEPGHTKIVEIEEYGNATSIAVSSILGNTRYIRYGDNLWFMSNPFLLDNIYKMTTYSNTKPYLSYTQRGIKVSILGKNDNAWIIELTNNTGSARNFVYNSKMCFEGDAQNWTNLSHNSSTGTLSGGEKTYIRIQEYGNATTVAISYLINNDRYIFYANKLDTSGTMTKGGAAKYFHAYTKHGMEAGIIGKSGGTWTIQLTNKTGSGRTFYYNSKMCFENDAKTWTGLSDVASVYLSSGESRQIQIRENSSATSIAISYTSGIDRFIFYANQLDAKTATMTSYGYQKPTYYTQNGMRVGIAGKSGKTWTLQLTNNTSSARSFQYNTKMCFEGDAKNWKGLSDVTSINLNSGESRQIQISENGTATSIAVSYMDGVYRKIFYAKQLDEKLSTMTSYANTIDTSQTPDGGCVAEGTMITLADGTQKAVEELAGGEMLLVWNMETGSFDSAPIVFIDSDLIGHYEVINLAFSDGTTVKVISEHGFWDIDLNKYVYLDENAAEFIGHRFYKQTETADGSYGLSQVELVGVEINQEVTVAYSPVTYSHLCYYVNGMLSMPGGITGLFNIFEIDEQTMTVDEDAFAQDIEEYGTFTYEEFYELYPIPEEVFQAFNAKYFKVAVGKGLVTYEQIGNLIERYSDFFVNM